MPLPTAYKYQDEVFTVHGDVVPFATIAIYNAGTATLSTIYSNSAGTVPLANPVTADYQGYFFFYALPSAYDLIITGTGITQRTLTDVWLGGSAGTLTSIATTSPLAGGPITTSGTISIADAVADGTTKGAAAFTAADFNTASGVVSIDYANAQASDGSHKGFLTSADWTTFNGKQAAIAGNTLAANNFANSIGAAGTISGAQLSAANLSNGTTGSGAVVLASTPTITTPTLTNPVVGTQSLNDNSTKAASTAYVDRIAPGGANAAITFWAPNGSVSGNTTVIAANVVRLAHFFLSNTVAFNKIGITNITADAANNYSFGVFSLDGTVRYAHTTEQAMVGSGTFRALSVVEGTITLAPGDYLFAWTGAATTASFNTLSPGASSRLTPSSSSTTTTLGAMPVAPINVPALSPIQAAVGIPSFILYQ